MPLPSLPSCFFQRAATTHSESHLNSDSLQKTLTLFSIVYKLFSSLSSYLCKKSARLFSRVYRTLLFSVQKSVLLFSSIYKLFFRRKNTSSLSFINLQTLFCKMSFFLKGLKLMAINPQLPYPRLRCQYRHPDRPPMPQARSRSQRLALPPTCYVRAMGFFSGSGKIIFDCRGEAGIQRPKSNQCPGGAASAPA